MAGRVTAWLSSNPVLSAGRWPLCLDGIVAWRVLRSELGHNFGRGELTADDCAETDGLDLPFERLDRGGDWVWAASKAEPRDPAGETVEWQHSRNNSLLYERRVPPDRQQRIDEARASWKTVRKPRVVTVCSGLSWTVECSDPERLMTILDTVEAVGKNWSRGNGQVASWEWEPLPGGVDWVGGMRPLPTASSAIETGIRPPYHHPAQRRPVVLP